MTVSRRTRLARHVVPAAVVTLLLGLLVPLATGSTAATGSATPSISVPAPPARQARPNIVVIMADDARADDLRWMPRTRRLIGKQGVRFTNSFAPFPLCCPARASFLTGQYTHNHGVWTHNPPFGFPAFRDENTLPVWLQQAGYTTLFVGKYLNGYGKRPKNGKPSVRYVPPGWSDWRGSIDGGLPANDPANGSTYRYWDMTLNVNGILEPHPGEYSTRMLGRQSVSMIHAYAPESKPFFLYASFVAPHHGQPTERDDPPEVPRNDGRTTRIKTPAVPAQARGRFDDKITKPAGLPDEKDVSDKPSHIRQLPPINRLEELAMLEGARQRAESLSVLDRQVANIIRALKENGELKKTLVIFTSDNGYFQGEHRRRQGKTLPYEPSLRTPLLMRGPGIPRGVTRSAPFLTIDFAPTILRAAGAKLRPSIDGQSLLRVARRGGKGWTRPILTESQPKKSTGIAKPFSTGIRAPRFLYVEHLNGERELYDMRKDPKQFRNVVRNRRYADDRRRLARILRDMRRCDGAECRRPLSSW